MMTAAPHDWPIEPSGQLGPMRLGQPAEGVVVALGEPRSVRTAEGLTFMDYEDITVVAEHGLVTMLIAEPSYGGETPQGVRTGLSVTAVEALVGPVTYDPEASLWRVRGGNHLAFEIVRPPRPGEEPIEGDMVTEAYRLLDHENATVVRVFLL